MNLYYLGGHTKSNKNKKYVILVALLPSTHLRFLPPDVS